MNTYTFVNTNKITPDGRFPIRVHKKDCNNIGLEIKRGGGSSWNIEAETVDEAIKIQEQDFIDRDMGAFDYDKEPCVKNEKVMPIIEYPNGNRLTVFGVIKK